MNDEKLDNLFEEAFRVEYRREFKEELKNFLLKEYEKRKRDRIYLRISTAIAACLVLTALLFLSFKLNIGSFRVSDSSLIKNEIEQVLNIDKSKESKVQENSAEEAKQTDDTKNIPALHESKTSNEKAKKENSTLSLPESSRKKPEQKSNSNTLSQNPKEKEALKNQANSKPRTVTATVQTTKSQGSGNKNLKVKEANNTKDENTRKVTIASIDANNQLSKEETRPDEEKSKESNEAAISQQVFYSVYVLKSESLDLKEEDIAKSLKSNGSAGVYTESLQSTTANSVYISIYQDYYYFEVSDNEDLKVMGALQQTVEEKVYKEAENILNSLGLENYRISVVNQESTYRANITFCYLGFEVYDSQGYIEFDKFGRIKRGQIYFKRFLPVQKVEVFDIQTAAAQFKRRYNLKDIDVSKIKLVYKKQGDVYLPVYIYINENKIYWLEK
ncbi:hypothetical protein [Caldicellulosiruptor naganoensis]|uniref:Uncharacterized protein n=1 Tax=Caldicellulosiruptor naganoensis TaxID=29324 RepID=A0ABY7BHC4_9FIRM|nr:hypothetical protein [Caldicellulosiruptor naganoensis]WAM31880.1 hypothetical protein OTJ99_000360 [Caldicellulosiruptor naganoensis]